MCLISDLSEIRLAPNDIIIYKVLRHHNDTLTGSFITNFVYELGKLYKHPHDLVSTPIKKCYMVKEGFHSFIDLVRANMLLLQLYYDDVEEYGLYKGYIPKGSQVIFNGYEIVSNQIVIKYKYS